MILFISPGKTLRREGEDVVPKMKYVSTRGSGQLVSAAQAIAMGIAEDGGLFVPESLPQLTQEDLSSFAQMDYQGRARVLMGRFLTDFSPEEVAHCVDAAYSTGKFASSQIAPIHLLEKNTGILELFHGPTCAFKDMALQILPHLMTLSVEKLGKDCTILILVATSGDTGKAALEGFRDVPGTEILVFYPTDGVSRVQKLQMMTQEGKNVSVCGIYGNFDDAQTGVKRIFTDPSIRKKLEEKHKSFSSANSINFGRLLPQVVYYFSAYADLQQAGSIQQGDPINVVVPTGNFGNILAAYYAKKMGLPVRKLICASNRNNVLTDFIRTGCYDRNRPFYPTSSPSMDILISSNLERLLYHLSDAGTVSGLMQSLTQKGCYTLPLEMTQALQQDFYGGCCDEEGTLHTIRSTFQRNHYLLDPHTAVAVKVLEDYRQETGDNTMTVLASTASPYKFSDSVLPALCPGSKKEGFDAISSLHAITGIPVPTPIAGLEGKALLHQQVCEKENMAQVVLSQL